MTDDNIIPQPRKTWRDLAEAVLRETDHDRILELAQQLCDAVDEQLLKGKRTGNA
jgi:hypothetical protein